jgi:hypothetical protein
MMFTLLPKRRVLKNPATDEAELEKEGYVAIDKHYLEGVHPEAKLFVFYPIQYTVNVL